MWIVLPPSLLAFSACAISEEMDGADADSHVIIPAGDSGDETSSDAAQGSDAVAARCAVGNLCRVATALSASAVITMNGRSKNDVWASGPDAVMIHWNGQQWTELEPGAQVLAENRYGALSNIFLTSSEAWGMVDTTRVLRRGFDVTSVRTAYAGGSSFSAHMSNVVAVFGEGEVYLTGYNEGYGRKNQRPVFKFDFESGALSNLPGPFVPGTNEEAELRVRASFLVPGKALWLVGEHAAVARYPVSSSGGDGGVSASAFGRGVVLPIASHADLLAAWGYGEELWAAGRNGAILHFDGIEWSVAETGTKATLNAIFGVSPSDIWAVGDAGTVLHFDGKTWSPVGIDSYTGNLRAVWASASDDVWIGGEGGMLHWGALQ